jgi:hypothetical protein
VTWAAGPYLSFDLETTGVDVENDRVVTAAIIDIRPGEPVRTRTWLVNPGIDIPAGATAVHKITTEMARADGVHPSTALDEIMLEIETAIASGIPLVAMNASYDFTLLDRELLRYKLGGIADRLGSYDALRPVLSTRTSWTGSSTSTARGSGPSSRCASTTRSRSTARTTPPLTRPPHAGCCSGSPSSTGDPSAKPT